MKLAVVTDSSAALPQSVEGHADLFCLDIPVTIDGETYVEGQNLTMPDFYKKMATNEELPKTSQPSLAEFDELLMKLQSEKYTHVIGLFLSSGISGFWANSQFLKDEYSDLVVEIPDTKITSAPQGQMVETALTLAQKGYEFDLILEKLNEQIFGTKAFILVDDLNHLVKGGRLSNGSALLGNLLSIKPILYFNDQGVIEVFEKVRTEKKAIKRLVEILKEETADGDFNVAIIHANVEDKAKELYQNLKESGFDEELSIVSFGSVIATHLGEGGIAFGITPKVY
ncbi:DegV family protein [Streptococcus thoraltensis]|uniref:DegV family protein n=1 Tax=Streptococcus thoraltensis TaxID=55085 RepID=UPI002A7FFE5C|nr:DegV family protein [Streptococcus thoraltensis]MDY4761062.1 DegV family protein [Streptococcus thoraltensis]